MSPSPHKPDDGRLPVRGVYFALGWMFFGLGLLGAFLPLLPTTPLMILALWAFARCSPRLHSWLYNHRTFGPPLQRWQEYRVIPVSAKMASIGAMTISFAYLALFRELSPYVLGATGVLMAYGGWYVLTKPSRPPERGAGNAPQAREDEG